MTTDLSADTSTQGVVLLNTPLPGSIDAGGDHDWFKLNVTESGVYTITVNAAGLANGDSLVALRGATGAVIATDDDDGASYAPVLVDSAFSVDATKPAGGESLSSRLVVTLKPGVYFIDVSTLLGSLGNTDPDDIGTYVLNVAHASAPVVTPPTTPVVTPPVVTPPVVTPPVVTPPVVTPPVATPPETTPPVVTPPVITPPVVTTPVVTPPVVTTPVVTPPVTTPVVSPPVVTTPVATTPATPPPSTAPATLSQTIGLDAQFLNVTRLEPASTAQATANAADPLHALVVAQQQIADQLNFGLISVAGAQSALFHLVDGTTSVASITYAYFTGRTPSAAGLNYLVHSDANPTDLNDPYFANLTTENRYVNMSVALATGEGEGAGAFAARFGALSLQQAATIAYADVFGAGPAAGKIDAILGALVPNGHGGTETRAQYFADITGGSAIAQKAALVGFLLSESVKDGAGPYAEANQNFLKGLADGSAIYETNLVGTYGASNTASGHSPLDPTLTG